MEKARAAGTFVGVLATMVAMLAVAFVACAALTDACADRLPRDLSPQALQSLLR